MGRAVVRTFRHRRGRILFEIFAAFLLASVAAANWVDRHSISSGFAAVPLTLYGIFRIVMLFARNPALGYGDRGVQVGRLFRVSEYRWGQVRELRETIWKRPYVPFMHWLPKERNYLELQILSSAMAIKIRADMMELPPNGVRQLIVEFRAAQIAALGERGAAMARLGGRQTELSQAPASGLQAERLQRLGIGSSPEVSGAAPEGQAAAARPVTAPSYPVFGRKSS